MDIAIIDYKMSNLHSVQAACDKVGLKSIITSDKKQILDSKVLILPGVGAFGKAMSMLKKTKLDESIYQFVESGKPFIGICLGLQLLFNRSDEFGDHNGLGLIKGKVKRFDFSKNNNIKYPVPQIGWNKINQKLNSWNDTPLRKNNNNDFMYFVHSYYVIPENKDIIVATTSYADIEYCSAIKYENIFATQFHPEKSGQLGLNIYQEIKKMVI